MENQNYSSEILSIVRGNMSPKVMNDKLLDFHENDLADIFHQLTVQERQKICRILSIDVLSNIFEYMEPEQAAKYLEEIDLNKAAKVLSYMESDFASDVLKLISKSKRVLIVQLMDKNALADITMVNTFDDDEIGSHMSTNYVVIRENLSVKEAMRELISQAATNDNIATLFVVTEDQKYYGAIDLKDLITAHQDSPLEDCIVTSYPYVYGEELVDNCIEKLKDYSENSIPILNEKNEILGVITAQAIVELVDDVLGDDYVKLAGLASEEDLNEPLIESMKKRLPWLFILLALGMVVSSVVGTFENVVSQLPIIMAFQSLILDMAGNVGTQSLAVTIRVLVDEHLTFKQKMTLVVKEMKIGFSNGLILGILSFILIGLFIWIFKGKTLLMAYTVSGCIGISLAIAMLISSLVGTLIPMLFKKLHVDPAVASGPLITTINDLVAVVVYYGLSWILLIQVFHF